MDDFRQDLTALSSSMAEQATALAQGAGNPSASLACLDMVRSARRIEDLAEQVLKLCAQQSRDAGHTWRELGDLLGVTRQAAFQRFGKPVITGSAAVDGRGDEVCTPSASGVDG
jgi:hypothetical protein